jgi:hypothetical protein
MLWLAATVGCIDEQQPVTLDPPASEPGAPVTTEDFPPAAPAFGTQLSVGGKKLQPGEEIEMCYYVNVGNEDTVWVSDMELSAAPGLHHSIVSRIGDQRPDSHSECFGFPSDLGLEIPIPLFATSTQVYRSSTELPPKVGIELEPHQQLIVNYHYLNVTSEPIDPEVYLNLYFAEPDDIESRAGMYAFTNVGDIAIPPHGKQKITMSCPFYGPGLLVTTTPHMHQLGSSFTVSRYTDSGRGEVLHEGEGWFDPETKVFDPPVLLNDGEGLTFTCEWESDRDQTTYFGESTDHEMCFVFGYFYPATIDIIGVDGFGCTVDENVITPAE